MKIEWKFKIFRNSRDTAYLKFSKFEFKNCGVRPQGPMYPFPPESKTSTLRAAPCDIVPDGRYIRGYKESFYMNHIK